MAAEGGRTMRAPADCIARSIGGTVTRLIGMLGPPDNKCVLTPLAANGLLQRVRSLLAQSRRSESSAYLSAFGVKRTSGEAAACFGPTLMTQSGHKPHRNPAAQRGPAAALVVLHLLKSQQAAHSTRLDSERFRSGPRTCRAALRQADLR